MGVTVGAVTADTKLAPAGGRVRELHGVGQRHVLATDELDGQALIPRAPGQPCHRQAGGARRQRRDVGPRGIQVEGPLRQVVCAVLVAVARCVVAVDVGVIL